MKVNNNYKKLAIAIVGISVIVIISIIIYTKIFKPKPITEIKKNIVYISGYYKEYPNDITSLLKSALRFSHNILVS